MHGDAARKVVVTVEYSIECTVEGFLKQFPTTAIANVISWNRAYCLFPSPTMVQRVTYPTKPLTKYDHVADQQNRLVITESAGTCQLRDPSWIEFFDHSSVARRELGPNSQIGDKYSWTIDLDVAGIEQPSRGLILDYASFSITLATPSFTRSDSLVPYLELNWAVLSSCTLRNSCLVPSLMSYTDGDMCANEFFYMIAHLQASVQSSALLQLTMLKPDARPADYNRVAVHEEKEETTIGNSTVSK
jgi:hypothetical protein